ncbi:DUF1361 domain-containing protein [Enterococcus dongliensis]|uniref:DUF1361 domain-containing protein n=1 Tax=Enterococcus dongliensis TaxID=2559925 RepID=UPI00288DDB6A|nr:DUF1361 domain-containing protein [Enterococcus dongliensis]MDT2614249.1 DUF1361 domain-containing protein [Enterococcus dongliensis]MDT2674278.1 DUF1361 domain-containing protein [Enterococcus dongliensis]
MKKVYLFHLSVLIYILFMHVTQETFSFMGLNVFLAWLPFIFAQLFLDLENKGRWLFMPLWLLFFPNTPYLLTDLFHLASLQIYQAGGHFLNTTSDWWAYLTLLLPVLVMVFSGMAQVFNLFSAIKLSRGQKIGSFVILSLLSSIAIYLGRFARIHSIELLVHPVTVLKLLLGDWPVEKIQFVLIFSILQLGIWGLIYFLQRGSQEE